MADDDDLTAHRGSGDFLADRGVADRELFRVKALLCRRITSAVDGGMTAAEIAEASGHPVDTIEAASRSRFDDIDVWTLMMITAACGHDIGITVGHRVSGRGMIFTQDIGDE